VRYQNILVRYIYLIQISFSVTCKEYEEKTVI
jgi:hypothetical protein